MHGATLKHACSHLRKNQTALSVAWSEPLIWLLETPADTRLPAQVRTFNLHALPELQLQGAVLVLQLQLSRPEGRRKKKLSKNKHLLSLCQHHILPSSCTLLRGHETKGPTVMKIGCRPAESRQRRQSLRLFQASVSHSSAAQKSRCLPSSAALAVTAVLPLFQFHWRGNTYATMRSDSSETSAFFSWTRWIHCSMVSESPVSESSNAEAKTWSKVEEEWSLPSFSLFLMELFAVLF